MQWHVCIDKLFDVTYSFGHLLRVGTYMFLKIWRLEHGQKLLKCHEKPSGVYTMQENVWQPGLHPGPRLGAYTALSDLADPLDGGEGTSFAFPRIPRTLQPFALRSFGSRLSSRLIFRFPELKS